MPALPCIYKKLFIINQPGTLISLHVTYYSNQHTSNIFYLLLNHGQFAVYNETQLLDDGLVKGKTF